MTDSKRIVIVDEQSLKDKLYLFRGRQVMLDFDLAKIYGYTTSAFNQQVKRNKNRFPEDFLFELTPDEMNELSISQNVISIQSVGVKGGRAKPIKAFTESGIYMLMTVLKGDIAIEQSIMLIRLFKSMKDHIFANSHLLIVQERLMNLTEMVNINTADISEFKKTMVTKAELSDFMKLFDAGIELNEVLILDGEAFKADLAYQKIYLMAKKMIVIIDDYISIKTLQHILHSEESIKTVIISDNKAKPKLRKSEYEDYIKENPARNITFIASCGKVHDRYILIDYDTEDMKVFHCGASSKDAGKRVTTIVQLKDAANYRKMCESLLNNPELILQ